MLFQLDERAHYVCCESADEELLTCDPDLFNCAICPVALAAGEVWPENLDAWRIFQRLASRLVVDTGIGAEVFRRLVEDLDAADVEEVVERVGFIYDLVSPQKQD